MELINKRHEDVSTRISSSPYISISIRGKFQFSQAACKKFGIQKGLFVHFIKDGKLLYLLLNTHADGFSIKEKVDKRRPGKQVEFYFASSPLFNYINQTIKIKKTSRFYLTDTDKLYVKQKLVEIMIDKPINKLGE